MDYELTVLGFREALTTGKLLGLTCRACHAYTTPPRKVCSICGGEDMEAAELSGRGAIETFSVVHVPPEGYEAPFTVVMVELEEGPWVAGNLVGVDPMSVDIGFIGKPVSFAGRKVVAPDLISAGERIALTFELT